MRRGGSLFLSKHSWLARRMPRSRLGSKAAFKISEPIFGALPTSRNKPVGVRRPNSNSAGKPAGRQGRGSFFRRRRRRLAARFVDGYPLIAQFHNTLPHPHSQTLAPQYPGTRLFVLLVQHKKLARTLLHPTRGACLCAISTTRSKVVENFAPRLCSRVACAIL